MKLTFENKNDYEIRPKLKPGANAVTIDNSSIFVGHFRHGIKISGAHISLVHAMNGRRSISQLAQYTGEPIDEISKLVELLTQNSLIDTHWPKLLIEGRFQSTIPNRPTHDGDFSEDGAVKELTKRLEPELAQASWRENSLDGGRNLIAGRQNIAINLHGNFAISLALYSLLHRAGFARTNLITNREARIEVADLIGDLITHSDIGSSRKDICERVLRESRVLGPVPNYEAAEFELNIAIGKVKNSDLQSWVSENKQHLIVRLGQGPNVIVGPLVLPGQTPCFNCVLLTEEESSLIWQGLHYADQFDNRFQIGATTINWLAGTLALAITQYADSRKSSLLGGAVILDPNNPFENENLKYPRHPNCGCAWNTLSGAH